MKFVASIILCALLASCETCIYERQADGQMHVVCRVQSDATNVTFQTRRTYFHADKLDNSTPTLAAATVTLNAGRGAAHIATSIVSHGIALPDVLPIPTKK